MSKCRTHFYRVGLPQKKNHILFRKLQNGLNRKQTESQVQNHRLCRKPKADSSKRQDHYQICSHKSSEQNKTNKHDPHKNTISPTEATKTSKELKP